MLEALDADAVRLWSHVAVDMLDEHRAEIDALNVFPVADSDTGSNALTTLRAADHELHGSGALDAAAALSALAIGAAHGALGNSGFILSQVVRGLADAAVEAGRDGCDAEVVAAGLGAAVGLARAAVVTPVEGTILSVVRAAADATAEVVAGGDAALEDVVTTAVQAADAALQRTPEQLADLARAGVVDAGGRALVVLLAALARVVTDKPVELSPVHVPAVTPAPRHDHDEAGHGYEVQYRLAAPESAIGPLRDALSALGDSVAVVATGPSAWNVHVHVDDVGAAVEAGLDAGRPSRIAVVNFAEQAERQLAGAAEPQPGPTAVLAVAPGAGLAHLFEREGVHVVAAGEDDLPDVDDVVGAILAAQASQVVLLPNASRVTGVAEAAAREARDRGRRVAVVPTRSPVQGLAAVAVHDPARRFDDDVVAMAEAAAATRFAELAVARDEALTAVGICQPGDILGLIDGEVVHVGRGLLAVAFTVVDRLLGVGAEMITVLVGADAPPRAGAYLDAHIRGRSPFTDVTVYDAGQADYPVIIGVE